MKTERYPSKVFTVLSRKVLKTGRSADVSEKPANLKTGKNSCVRDYHWVQWDRMTVLKEAARIWEGSLVRTLLSIGRWK